MEGLQVPEDRPPKSKEAARRILLVDDDASIRHLNTKMLIRAGYEVDDAADGEAGWEALQAKRYDLLITDNFMPKVTGIDFASFLYSAITRLSHSKTRFYEGRRQSYEGP